MHTYTAMPHIRLHLDGPFSEIRLCGPLTRQVRFLQSVYQAAQSFLCVFSLTYLEYHITGPANVTFSVPAMGDSFLVSDTSISVQWSSCDVGVYPHLMNLSLWQNGVMLSTLASNIDDLGKVISPHWHTHTCFSCSLDRKIYVHIILSVAFIIYELRILSMVQRSPRGFQLYASTLLSPSQCVFRRVHSRIGQLCYQC